MKPRILITMHYMELGGAETSLIGLLGALDPERVNVDLFIHSHRGPLMRHIPAWVNVLPEIPSYAVIESPITDAIKCGQWGVVYGRCLAKAKHFLYKRNLTKEQRAVDCSEISYVADSVEKFLPDINPDVEYDLCISYITPHNYAKSKGKAKKRMAWIHTDYSTVSVNAKHELKVWNCFDYIASISPDVTRAFVKTYPSLESRIIEIENIMPVSLIHNRAEDFSVSDEMPFNNGINLLSIGRYTFQKNFDNVPAIASRMVDMGLKDFKWYLIGYGEDEALIRQRIAENGMEQHVIILGKKVNPYPYIKACDIYVQPSRYEGKSITVREAQLLGKPVVITNYPTASSQIKHGFDGVIVPIDNEGCANGIVEFIQNSVLQKFIVKNLNPVNVSGLNQVEKIYNIIE